MSIIFILAVTALIGFLWKERLRHVAAWWRRTPLLRDRAFGLAELYLPDGWRPGRDLNEHAGIEAVDPLHARYAWIISESKDDFDARLDIEEHAARTRDALTESLLVLGVRGPEHRTVCGFPAVQFEIEAVHEMIELKFLHTTVSGRRGFHQIVAWSTRSGYSRKVLEKVVDGFRETPGPDPQPRAHERQPAQPRPLGFRPPAREKTPL